MVSLVSGPERMTSENQLSLYVRQWHPSTLTLDIPKEVVLKESLVEYLKEEVSRHEILAVLMAKKYLV